MSAQTKPKFSRVAVEGNTIDGRVIKREWLEQAAANYDPSVYSSRVWSEHMRSMFADSPFSAQGDVIAVKVEEIKHGKLAGKLGLFAQLKPLDSLLQMNQAGKKLFTSIEIDPNFAQTGEAYLTGIAVTDTPASLGTEMLTFTAKGATAKFSSEFMETELDFGAETGPDDAGIAGQVVKAFAGVLEGLRALAAPKSTNEAGTAFTAKTLEALTAADAALQHQAKELGTATKTIEKMSGDLANLQTEFKTLTEKLSAQDGDTTRRPEATGNEGGQMADC